MKLRTRWTLITILLLAPYLLVLAAGWAWLYEHGYILWWALVAGLFGVAGRVVYHHWRRRATEQLPCTVEPSPHWPPRDLEAWQKVEELAERVRREDRPLDSPESWWELLQEVLDVVARHYHPESDDPRLETPIPHLARVVALVALDLERFSKERLPGGHLLTINDLRFLFGVGSQGYRAYPWLYNFLRLVRLGEPISAALREVSDWISGGLIDRSTSEVKQWFLDLCVKRAGQYAIELYSGRLVLADSVDHVTQASRADVEGAEEQVESLDREPLRVLVVGQVKSGKSSLINALFGQVRAATDVLPLTKHVTPYLIGNDGLQQAILLDTAGYEDPTGPSDPFAGISEQVLLTDLVLVVCHAKQAARDPDRRVLDRLRELYGTHPDRKSPPMLVVLTHIDQLRPVQEWSPPYDLTKPDRPKTRQILDAMDAVTQALNMEPEQIVPARLDAGQLYNVSDGLVPAIMHVLPAAQYARAARVLKDFQRHQNRQLLWKQAINAGRLLVAGGKHIAGRVFQYQRES